MVFHQFTEIQTLKKTVGRLMQERMQRQFVKHTSPAHVATTKGESVRKQATTAAPTDSAAQHTSSTEVPTAVPEAAQTDSAVRSQATTTTTAPKAKSKGVVIQEPTSEKPKEKICKKLRERAKK